MGKQALGMATVSPILGWMTYFAFGNEGKALGVVAEYVGASLGPKTIHQTQISVWNHRKPRPTHPQNGK